MTGPLLTEEKMRRLINYLKKYKKEAVLAPLFKMLEAILELFVPLIVARMIDIGIPGQNTGYILRMSFVLLLLAAVGLAVAITAQYFAAKAAVMTGDAIRRDLFSHIMSLSWTQIDEQGTSTLVTRMTSDINTVQNGINMFLRLFMRSPFVVFGALIMAFTVDARSAGIFALIIPLLLVIIFVIMLVTMPLYRLVQQRLDSIMQTTRENLLGVRVVRAFNRQNSEMRIFDEEAGDLFRRQVFAGKISALLNPLTYAIINLGIVAVLWAGGKQVNAGRLTRGEVIALINYMSQILVELVKLASLIILLSRALAGMKRIDSVFLIKNNRKDGSLPFPADSSITFSHVNFAYSKDAEDTLREISFHADAGSTTGIIGGTGSGKSTLVHLLPRFYDVREGSIQIGGTDVRDIRTEDLRRHIGMVPQRALLFKGTLRENMQWGCRNASDEQIWKALRTAQAEEFVREAAEGLDMTIEQEGRNLSGGQRQRLTIARALVSNPDILILDDSASALDYATDAALRKSIHTEEAERTVILISQRVSTVRNADQILVLADGHLEGTGTHEELLRTCEEYRHICESQGVRE